jgi:GNAT superfamily N-acetyltransferase
MRIEFSDSHSISDFLTQKINEENTGYSTAYPFAFVMYDDHDEIIAGANGSIIFGAIYTDQLWVHSDYRKVGFGRKLMKHIHAYGKKQGCTMATVNTMSFQKALDFYKKLGYHIDYTRPGYEKGASCVFLQRDL